MREQKKEGNRWRWTWLLLLLLLPLLVWQGFRYGGKWGGEGPPAGSRPDSVTIDPDAGDALEGVYVGKTREEILAELERKQLLVTDTCLLTRHSLRKSRDARGMDGGKHLGQRGDPTGGNPDRRTLHCALSRFTAGTARKPGTPAGRCACRDTRGRRVSQLLHDRDTGLYQQSRL